MEIELSRTERLILSNQFQILANLTDDKDERDWYIQRQEIVERGYELHYRELFERVSREPYSEEQCRWVLDVLQMYEQLQRSQEDHPIPEVTNSALTFMGFCGNTECEEMGYANFFCERLDRYTHLKKSEHMNSHCPMRSVYQQMLGEWKKSRDPLQLTGDDVLRIMRSKKSPA